MTRMNLPRGGGPTRASPTFKSVGESPPAAWTRAFVSFDDRLDECKGLAGRCVVEQARTFLRLADAASDLAPWQVPGGCAQTRCGAQDSVSCWIVGNQMNGYAH